MRSYSEFELIHLIGSYPRNGGEWIGCEAIGEDAIGGDIIGWNTIGGKAIGRDAFGSDAIDEGTSGKEGIIGGLIIGGLAADSADLSAFLFLIASIFANTPSFDVCCGEAQLAFSVPAHSLSFSAIKLSFF